MTNTILSLFQKHTNERIVVKYVCFSIRSGETPEVATEECRRCHCDPDRNKDGEYELMSVDTIINGKVI